MSVFTKIGGSVAKIALKLGIYKFIGPSLRIKEIQHIPIRMKDDSIEHASAVLYQAKIKNEGSKTAYNCRPYLKINATREFDPNEEYTLVEEYEDSTTEENVESIEMSLESEVFWIDEIDPIELIEDKIETNTEKDISPGEKAHFAFGIFVAGHGFRFLGPGGYHSPAIPKMKINGVP